MKGVCVPLPSTSLHIQSIRKISFFHSTETGREHDYNHGGSLDSDPYTQKDHHNTTRNIATNGYSWRYFHTRMFAFSTTFLFLNHLKMGQFHKSLAFKGRRFETWQEIVEAVQKATVYCNEHKHPYIWGRRRRHRPHKGLGIAQLPKVA